MDAVVDAVGTATGVEEDAMVASRRARAALLPMGHRWQLSLRSTWRLMVLPLALRLPQRAPRT